MDKQCGDAEQRLLGCRMGAACPAATRWQRHVAKVLEPRIQRGLGPLSAPYLAVSRPAKDSNLLAHSAAMPQALVVWDSGSPRLPLVYSPSILKSTFAPPISQTRN